MSPCAEMPLPQAGRRAGRGTCPDDKSPVDVEETTAGDRRLAGREIPKKARPCVIPRRAKALAWIHNPRSSVVVVGPLAGTIKDWTSIAFTITERLARPVVKLVDEEKEGK